jgi:nucleotide sugar dehydrogenase
MQNHAPDFSVSSTVAVIGLGRIGLPLAVQYARHGRHVIGCDINPQVVEMVNSGRAHIQEEPQLASELADLVERGLFSATVATSEAVSRAGVVVVIVPVIIDAQKRVDFASIDAATMAIGKKLQPGTLVIYETTLPVSTTSLRLRRILEETSHLRAGQDFYLAYSPERVSSGHIFRDLRIYPKIVGGIDEQSKAVAVLFYRSVLDADIITMHSTDEAEFVKLIETTYRDVNIALANEYACYADDHGLDVNAAIAAANTQPYSHIHQPGLGVGGHCIPVYPYFLFAGTELAEQPSLTLSRSARRINDAMASYAIRRLEAVMGSLAHQAVLILGVSYRADVREAAFTSAKLLQQALWERGARVYVDDPLFSDDELRELGYMPFVSEYEKEVQAIILQAAHQIYQEFDFKRFLHCKVVLDGRNALKREKIESLGKDYISIGDGYREKLEE